MKELSLHILDIAENSVAAQASIISILVEECPETDRLLISIADNGTGMDAETQKMVVNPFYTSKSSRKVGLGIPLFKAAAEACNGYFRLSSRPSQGTQLEAFFQYSHIDRMPLGNLSDTYLNLIVCYPHIEWHLEYQRCHKNFTFDGSIINSVLDGIPVSEPSVITYLREYIYQGITDAKIIDYSGETTKS